MLDAFICQEALYATMMPRSFIITRYSARAIELTKNVAMMLHDGYWRRR